MEGRVGKKGVICKIASYLLGEGEITDRYDLGVFACLQKLWEMEKIFSQVGTSYIRFVIIVVISEFEVRR